MKLAKAFLAFEAAVLIMIILLSCILVFGDELYSSMWDKGVVVVLYGSQYGTGFWVHEEYIVTAAHVVNFRSNVRATVVHGDYQSIAYVIYVDSLHDVAVLRVEKKPSSTIYIWSLSLKGPEKGQRVFVIGYPFELYKIIGDIGKMSSNPRICEGIVAWVYPDKSLFEFSAATDAGNSGGPIVDSNGNVLGLVSFAMPGKVTYLFYGTSIDAIKAALEKCGVKYRVGLGALLQVATPKAILTPTVISAVVAGGIALVISLMVIGMKRGRRR